MIDKTCCCGIPLQRGVRLIGSFDIVLAFSSVFCLIFSDKLSEWVNGLLQDDNPAVNNLVSDLSLHHLVTGVRNGSSDVQTETFIIIALVMAYTTIDICASTLLIHGSSNKSQISCRWWLRLRIFLLMCFILYFFVEMGRSSLFLYGVIDILMIFYRMYCLSTVNAFIRQLDKEEIQASRRRRSIVIPYVQVITPEGSYSALFPCVGDNGFPPFHNGDIPGILQQDDLPSSPTQCLISD